MSSTAQIRIEQVGIAGAGLMGHALALVHALGGCQVTLHDKDPAVLEQARELIGAACETLIAAGSIDATAATDARARITFDATLAGTVAQADLVIEAVSEDPGIKQQVFADIDRHAPAHAIIASNTSYLDIFPLIPQSRQANAIVAHWYTPPYIVDLVDIAPGPHTRQELVSALHDLYAGFGKEPLVFKKLIPGYIANRLQSALNLECFRMIDEGWVSAEEIDRSIAHGLVLRLAVLGHMRKLDYTGLHVVKAGLANRTYEPPQQSSDSATLSRLLDQGHTGVASGSGFFDYADHSAEQLFRQRDRKLLQLKAFIAQLNESEEYDQSRP